MVKDNSVQSIERAFKILELFRTQNRAMGVIEIASVLGLSTTTVHRLLQTLIQVKAVHQDPNNRWYDLSPHMLLYGKAVLNRYDFLRSVHPVLGELSKLVGETVFMGILDEDCDLVYIDHVESLDHPLRMTPQIGLRQPAHSTSMGKVLLSGLNEEKLYNYMNNRTFAKMTDFTIVNPTDLLQELNKVRCAGYGLDQEETEIGVCCVAAPLCRSRGMVAAISISGPASRMRSKGLETWLREKICSTAEQLSQLIQKMEFGG